MAILLNLVKITQVVSAAWRNWKRCSGVLCDRRMPVKLKGKVYKKNCGQTSSVGVVQRHGQQRKNKKHD